MHIIKSIHVLHQYLDNQPQPIGFVPTMGALHEGHISLINSSKLANATTVCSIFVNPTQFNDPKDFEKYPITLESDIEKLIDAGTDILFLPNLSEMYPDGITNIKKYNIGYLDNVLDGEFRPGHFNGVCAIVHKLLNAVRPQKMYLGEKDFQQCMVVKLMIHQEEIDCKLVTCPTLREQNGLAMSSRNARLSVEGKEAASLIYKCLQKIKSEQESKSFLELKAECLDLLEKESFKTEYIYLAEADSLKQLDNFELDKKMVVLIATHFEGVRLIDNMRMN
jgi:pantoate--beta-alanine ligase